MERLLWWWLGHAHDERDVGHFPSDRHTHRILVVEGDDLDQRGEYSWVYSGTGGECRQHLDRAVQGYTSTLAVQPAGHVQHHRSDTTTQPGVALGDLPFELCLNAASVPGFTESELDFVALTDVRDRVLEGTDCDPHHGLGVGTRRGGVEHCDTHAFAFRQSLWGTGASEVTDA